MRITSVLSKILRLKQTLVRDLEFDQEGVVLDVAPTTRVPRCSGCERKVSGTYDRRAGRQWRHRDFAGMKVHLRCDVRRVSCPRCGVRVEKMPWAAAGSWFTYDFEDEVGYLTQRCDKTTVCRVMRIAWTTVGDIVQRVVERHGDDDKLDDLVHIGIDELSYRRHHKYVTVVVCHDTARVVWAQEGKDAETVKQFFAQLGDRAADLEAVTIDMSKAYIKAVTEASVQAKIIFDRFHVQRLAHDALDQVRRDQVRACDDPADRRVVKHSRWALLKNPWNLTQVQAHKLSELQRDNRKLYRAYLLKEGLLAVLDLLDPSGARQKLAEWLSWAARSKLRPFVKLARTIRHHQDGILAYVETGFSNGRAEGLNGKIRTITRRSFGLHSAQSLIALIFLCCGGIRLDPVHRYPA